MSKTPTRTELVRDAALDDDFSLDEALVLIKRLNAAYGKDVATKKVLNRLVDILIGVQSRSRIVHQTAEQAYQAERTADEAMAQFL